jgi:hypothetical protein
MDATQPNDELILNSPFPEMAEFFESTNLVYMFRYFSLSRLRMVSVQSRHITLEIKVHALGRWKGMLLASARQCATDNSYRRHLIKYYWKDFWNYS